MSRANSRKNDLEKSAEVLDSKTQKQKNISKNTKKSSEFVCDHCGKEFVREASYLKHCCEKKKRFDVKDTPWSKIAQEAYVGLFPSSSTYRKCRTFDHFSSSNLYNPLISFGKFVVNSDIISYRKYVKYLQINNVNVKDWTDEKVYGLYLKNLFSKEDPEDAVIRTLEFIEKWSRDNNKEWENFFSEIHPIEAIRHIKTGRLSPWIILQDGIADKLFDRILDEQLLEVADIIDPTYWGIRFKKQNHKIQETLDALRGFNE